MRRARGQRRLSALLVAYFVLTALMAGKLVTVQVVDAAEYRGLAAQQRQRELDLPASRGRLSDRTGQPLAMSLSAATIFANPRLLREAEVATWPVASALAALLDRDAEDIDRQLGSDAEFVYLARQLPREVGEQITDLELPGIGVVEEPTRVYPAGRIASQVIGFAGVDNSGLAGLELAYDDVLAGQAGTLRLERAPGGLEITAAPREAVPATAGADVILTIDREVQYETEQILADAVETYEAKGGSAVVLDARTAEILALASVPSVAPPEFPSADPYNQRNRAVTDVFEPGSVNKVITIAGALEDGVVGPGTGFQVPAQLAIGPEVFHDSSGHPTAFWSTREILTRSSNVGTIRIAQQLGSQRLHHYVQAFGLGRETGLGFPGESRGLLAEVDEWTISSLPTIAIGQGVSATLLQVANVFNTLANDGEWVEPALVRGTVDTDGAFTAAAAPQRRRVVSVETARTVSDMLVDVVESDDGTGTLAAVRGYRVGGKTGTAQKPLEDARGYAEDAYIGTFAGFAPASDPALIVAVMLDEPTPYYGGLTAAPTFSRIMDFALTDQRIPPSEPSVSTPEPAGQRLGHTMAVPVPAAPVDELPPTVNG